MSAVLTKLIFLALALLLVAELAFAQQPASSLEQALLQKLNVEVSSGLQCSVALITTQQESDKLKARIKELEAKYEPK